MYTWRMKVLFFKEISKAFKVSEVFQGKSCQSISFKVNKNVIIYCIKMKMKLILETQGKI